MGLVRAARRGRSRVTACVGNGEQIVEGMKDGAVGGANAVQFQVLAGLCLCVVAVVDEKHQIVGAWDLGAQCVGDQEGEPLCVVLLVLLGLAPVDGVDVAPGAFGQGIAETADPACGPVQQRAQRGG